MGARTAGLTAVMALLVVGCGSGKKGGGAVAGVSDGGASAGALPDGFFSVTLPEGGADARADGAGMAAVVPTMLQGKVVLPPGFPTPMGQLKVQPFHYDGTYLYSGINGLIRASGDGRHPEQRLFGAGVLPVLGGDARYVYFGYENRVWRLHK